RQGSRTATRSTPRSRSARSNSSGTSRIEPAVGLSRTWKARLQRWRGHTRTAATVALSAAAVFGAAAGCRVFLAPQRPDIATIAQRIGNQDDQVGAFASDFIVTWLTATTAQ